MRSFITAVLAVTVLGFSSVAHAEDPGPLSAYEGADLSEAQLRDAIAYIEKTIKLPEDSDPLEAYGRYYTQHKGIVHAVFTKGWGRFTPGVHIVPTYNDLPLIFDGGCSVIDVIYIPQTKAITARCHGHA